MYGLATGSTFVAISATGNRVSCEAPIGFPNAVRSLTYAVVQLSAASAPATVRDRGAISAREGC